MSATTVIQRSDDDAKAEKAFGLQLPFDLVLVLATLGLAACSLLTIASATANDIPGSPDYYLIRQLIYFVVGALLAALLWRSDYSRLRELKYFFYGLLIASILAVIVFGSVARGSRRAVDLPLFSFQASELGKVLLIVALSAFTIDMTRRMADRRTTVRLMLIGFAPAALVMLQPDLGSALVFVAVTLAVLFIAGVPWQHFAAFGALAAVAVALSLAVLPSVGINVLHSYQKDRLTAFLHPSETSGKEGYQQNQSRIAIGSGEKTGRGSGATQTKYNFLPEHHIGRWHRCDADVPGLRQRWNDGRHPADYGNPVAADELRRLVANRDDDRRRSAAVDLRSRPQGRDVAGTGAPIPMKRATQ